MGPPVERVLPMPACMMRGTSSCAEEGSSMHGLQSTHPLPPQDPHAPLLHYIVTGAGSATSHGRFKKVNGW